MNWFEMFPTLTYDGVTTRDVTRRVILNETYRHNPLVFLPYTIKEGQRADQIAKAYYGKFEYTWLVWLSNKIIDPYYEWPLFGADFDKYLIKKYADRADANGLDVVNWTMNELTDDNIIHFVNVQDPNQKISADSKYAPWFVADEWRAVRIYEDEYARNEAKRNIHLVDVNYVPVLVKKINSVLKE